MLRCLFGKCSTETYIVNRDGGAKKDNIGNGVSKIVPILVNPESHTSVGELNNHTNTNNITNPVISQSTVHHNDESITLDNKEEKNITPTPNQISSQKADTHENPEKGGNNRNTLLQNDDINETGHKGNGNNSVPQNKRPQAPQPPDVKSNINSKVLTPATKEQREPIPKETEQGNYIVSAPVLESYQENTKKEEKVTAIIKTQDHIDNYTEEDRVSSVPVLNSSQNNDKRKEKDAVITKTQDHVTNDQKLIDHVSSTPVLNSSQDNDREKRKDIIITKTQDHIINDQKSIDHTSSAPILISSQGNDRKDEKVVVIAQDHIINDKKSTDHVSSVTAANNHQTLADEPIEAVSEPVKRRSGVVPLPVKYDETVLPHYPKDPDDEVLIKSAIERNDFLNKIISGKRLKDVIQSMYNKEIASKETIVKQGEKGSHMYISAKGKFQVLVKGKVVSEFNDVRVFGELAILYNAKRLATIKALTPGRVWVLDRSIYQQIMLRYNINEQDEIMQFLKKNKTLNVVGENVLQEVANLLKPEFFHPGKQIVRQGDKGDKFYIIRAGTVTITKAGEGEVGIYEKGDCFGELALLKEDCRQATVTANAPGVECLTLTRKEFIDYFGEVGEITNIKPRSQNSIKDAVAEYIDVELTDLKIIKTLGIGGFGRVELVQHVKKKDLVFALKYLKKIDIVMQHQQDHVYNEKIIQMTSKSPFIIRLYRTYKDSKYIYFLMESCLGGDLWSLLQKQKLRRFDEKEARFIAACVLEAFDYLHSRGIVYRDLKPENLLIAANGYIKLTDFGFAKKISTRGRTYTFAGTPEYVAPEIVLNKGHDRAVDYWAFGAFIFELLTGRTPFRTDDSSHMKTYTKILNGIDNIAFPSYVNLKARHIVEKLCRPIPAERLGMQRGGIKDIKMHKWFLGWDWQKFSKCEMSSPFKPKLKSPIDTQYFDQFKKDTDDPPQELSGWDVNF